MVLWYFLLGSTYRMSLLGVLTSGLVALLQGIALLPGMIPPPPIGAASEGQPVD
jgi:hypothetical protein